MTKPRLEVGRVIDCPNCGSLFGVIKKDVYVGEKIRPDHLSWPKGQRLVAGDYIKCLFCQSSKVSELFK